MKKVVKAFLFCSVLVLCMYQISCKRQVLHEEGFLFDCFQINEADIEQYEIIYQKDAVRVSVGIQENKPYFSELTDFLNCKISLWEISLKDYLMDPIQIRICLQNGKEITFQFYSFELEDGNTVMGVYWDGYLYRMDNQDAMKSLHVSGDLVRDPLYWFMFRYDVSAFGLPKEMIVERQGTLTEIPEVKTYRWEEPYLWPSMEELCDAPMVLTGKIRSITPITIRQGRIIFNYHGWQMQRAAAVELEIEVENVFKGNMSSSIKVRVPFDYGTEKTHGELVLGESQKELSIDKEYFFFLQEIDGNYITYDLFFGMFEINNGRTVPLFNIDPLREREYSISIKTIKTYVNQEKMR